MLSYPQLLMNKNAFATPLCAGLFDEFGVEWLSWEPDTLLKEIEDYWRVKPPEVNRDKIWALATVYTTDLYVYDVNAFVHISNSLNGDGANFQHFEPPSVQSMCWAITEILLNEPTLTGFGYDLKTYIETSLKYEGLERVPKLLKNFVTEHHRSFELNDMMEVEGIDYKSFWDKQARAVLEIDKYVQGNLIDLLSQLSMLKLKNAKPGAQKELLDRVQHSLDVTTSAAKKDARGFKQKIIL